MKDYLKKINSKKYFQILNLVGNQPIIDQAIKYMSSACTQNTPWEKFDWAYANAWRNLYIQKLNKGKHIQIGAYVCLHLALNQTKELFPEFFGVANSVDFWK